MSTKLEDRVAACNLIRSKRKESRLHNKHKSISIDIGDGLLARLLITYRISTGCASFGHCLQYNRYAFFPTTHQKLRCTNQHALDVLDNSRKRVQKNNKLRRRKRDGKL